MPIWDEEWWVRNSPACTDDIYCEEAKYIFTGLRAIGQPGFEEARARAKLAASAPKMWRILLALGDEKRPGGCAWCGIVENDPCATLSTGHHAHCPLGDVLFEAVEDWPADFNPLGRRP